MESRDDVMKWTVKAHFAPSTSQQWSNPGWCFARTGWSCAIPTKLLFNAGPQNSEPPQPQSCVLTLTTLLRGYKCLPRHAGKTGGIWTQLKQHLHQIRIFVSQSKVLVMFFSGTHFLQGDGFLSCGVALGHVFLLPLCVVLVSQNKQSCSNKNWPTLSSTQELLSQFRTQ